MSSFELHSATSAIKPSEEEHLRLEDKPGLRRAFVRLARSQFEIGR